VSELVERGIQTTHYPAITTLSDYSEHPSCPRAEDLAARQLVLPLASSFELETIELVARSIVELVATPV